MIKEIEDILIKVAKNGTKGTNRENINLRVIMQAREDILNIIRKYNEI